MSTKEINVLVLAYMGDTIYERYIREYLIKKVFLMLMIFKKNLLIM